MKKILLSCVFIIFCSLSSKAQLNKYGVRLGLNLSSISSDDIPDELDDSRYGAAVGFFADFALSQKLRIMPELQYTALGNKDEAFRVNYINLPVVFKYNVTHWINLQLGPQAGLKIWEWEDETDEEVNFNTFDFSALAGIGFDITDNFFADIRYGFGLGEIFDDEDLQDAPEGSNRYFQLSVGYRL